MHTTDKTGDLVRSLLFVWHSFSAKSMIAGKVYECTGVQYFVEEENCRHNLVFLCFSEVVGLKTLNNWR